MAGDGETKVDGGDKVESNDKYGEAEKEVPDILNANRKCRDVICLIIFILAWVAWIILAIMAFSDGCPDQCNDPRKLIYGYDSNGCRCGADCSSSGGPDNRDKLRLYIPDPRALDVRICVASCPATFSADKNTSVSMGAFLCPQNTCNSCPSSSQKGQKCFSNERKAGSLANTGILAVAAKADACFLPSANTSDCWYPTYPTTDIFFKCAPSLPNGYQVSDTTALPFDVSMLGNTTSSLTNPAGEIGQMVAELSHLWRLLVVSVAIAVAMGFVYLILLRLFAKLIMFVTLFGLLIVLAICSLFAWDKTGKIHVFEAVSKTTGVNVTALPGVSDSMKTPTEPGLTYAAAVILTVLTIAYAVILCIMIRRLIIAIDIIQEAAKSMAAMPMLLLLPLTTFLALLFLYLWAGFITIYLLSAGQFDPKTGKFVYAGGTCSKDVSSVKMNISQPTVILTLKGLSTLSSRSFVIQHPFLTSSDALTDSAFPVGACLGFGRGLATNCTAAMALKQVYFANANGVPGTVDWNREKGAITVALPAATSGWLVDQLQVSINLNATLQNPPVLLQSSFGSSPTWSLQSTSVVSQLNGVPYDDASRYCNLYTSTARALDGVLADKRAALKGNKLSDVNELPAVSFLSGISVSNWKSALPVTLDGSTYNYFAIFHLFSELDMLQVLRFVVHHPCIDLSLH